MNSYLQKCVDYCEQHRLFDRPVTVTLARKACRLHGFMLDQYESVLAIVSFDDTRILHQTHFSNITELEKMWKQDELGM
jgi:hypothetical protein